MQSIEPSPAVTRLDDYRKARRRTLAPSEYQKLYDDLRAITEHIIKISDILCEIKIPTGIS